MKIRKLDHRAQPELYNLLTQNTTLNLFLLERLFLKGIQSWGQELWFGVYQQDKLTSVSLVMGKSKPNNSARLIATYGTLEGCRLLGKYAAQHGGTVMIVGPRAESDSFVQGLGNPLLRLNHPQQLYSCVAPTQGPQIQIRAADKDDLEQLIVYSAEMMAEELNENPLDINPKRHRDIVQTRINNRRTWVGELRRGGAAEIGFVLDIGFVIPLGVQVGGTFVPKHLRGQGLSKAGMRASCSKLLKSCKEVTLHVNERNIPAVRCYEGVGFIKKFPYRLAAIEPQSPPQRI